MGKIIELFKDNELTPELRSHLIQRCADMAIEIALLQSEYDRLQRRLEE